MARITAQRLALSAFLVVHLTALAAWNLPEGALKTAIGDWPGAYFWPTGQWQQWGMFAPEASTNILSLRAVARDARGLIHRYDFPRMAEKSAWSGFAGGYRHSKYLGNAGQDAAIANREVAARHVARALALPREAYPLDVQLLYDVRPIVPPGAAADAEPAAPWESVIDTYRFATPEEADS